MTGAPQEQSDTVFRLLVQAKKVGTDAESRELLAPPMLSAKRGVQAAHLTGLLPLCVCAHPSSRAVHTGSGQWPLPPGPTYLARGQRGWQGRHALCKRSWTREERASGRRGGRARQHAGSSAL